MAAILKLVLAGTCGMLLGLLLTIASLAPEARGVTIGPWRGTPREGAVDADPYALAGIERAGTLPLGAAEGVSFLATTDDAGAALSPACVYRVIGMVPPARFWTLSVLTPDGFPIANPAGRYGFTSAELLRRGDEPAIIVVSRSARAGNWLPIGQAVPFVLALRLYDTGLSALGGSIGAMPAIRKMGCET